MIQLFVEPYCATCPEFEPYVTKNDEVITTINSFDIEGGGTVETHLCDTRIYCKHRGRCNSIYTHARESIKRGDVK